MSVKTRVKRRVQRLAARLLPPPSTDSGPRSRLLSTMEIAGLGRDRLEEACRDLASPVYVGEDTGLCRILGRYKMYVDTRDVTIAAHLLLEGYWETWLTQFMARLVQPGWTVADIGANYGYYTLLLADLVGPGGRVVAVEPNPEAAALLRRSVFLNGFGAWTAVHEVAAGAADGGTATLLVPRTMTGGASIAEVASVSLPDIVEHRVPVTSLDTLLAGEGRIDFLKIDVEASEERIIAGMERVFARGRPPMVLEFNPARYADPRAFLAHLTALYGSLREVDFSGDASSVEAERVLGEPTEWLLFLSRG
jgi:FkbM family methyltransferase